MVSQTRRESEEVDEPGTRSPSGGGEEQPGAASRPAPAPRRLLEAARRPPYRPALVVVAVAVTMAGLFVTSYSLALGRPTPHAIPAAVVGEPAQARALIADVERGAGSALHLRPYPSAAAARRALAEQQVYAALVLDARPPQLLVASAAGASVARVLRQAGQQAAERAGRRLAIVDVRPLPPTDPQGLVEFYVALAATILGFIAIFQLRAHASELTLRAWLGFVGGLAVLGGLVLAVVVGPLLGSLRGPFPEIWALLALEMATAALVASTMSVLVGGWAIVPTWLLFVVLGNTSSGGAVAPPLLPPFYAFLSRFLSPGATVDGVRTAVYFTHEQHIGPFLVLVAWAVAGLAALLLASRLRGWPGG